MYVESLIAERKGRDELERKGNREKRMKTDVVDRCPIVIQRIGGRDDESTESVMKVDLYKGSSQISLAPISQSKN